MATPCSCGKPDCIDCLIQSLAPTEDRYVAFGDQVPIETVTLVVRPYRGPKEPAELAIEQGTLETIRGCLHELATLARIAGLESTVHVRRRRA